MSQNMSQNSAGRFQLDIVAPNGKIFSEQVMNVTIPGEEGRFGVLPKMAPFLSSLRAGMIEIYEADKSKKPVRHFVSGGFTEISNDQCTILVDAITSFDELAEKDIQQQIQNLKEDVEDAKTDQERLEAERALKVEEVKLREFLFYS